MIESKHKHRVKKQYIDRDKNTYWRHIYLEQIPRTCKIVFKNLWDKFSWIRGVEFNRNVFWTWT